MPHNEHEVARRAVLERGSAGVITFEELDELLPDDVVDTDAVEQWLDFLDESAIELVPHRALRNGKSDAEQPLFVTDVELVAGDAVVAAKLYWVACVTWDDELDRFVFALAEAKVPHAEAAFAERAAALGYAIGRTETAITIDLRAMASAHLTIAHDDYARDRGGFAAIAPSRLELLTAEPRELQDAGYWIASTAAVSFTLLLDVPVFVGPTSYGNVELTAECRIEFREWGIKWLDLTPTSCPLPASVDAAMIAASGASLVDGTLAMRGAEGCRLAAELLTEGHTLGFVATGLHIIAAR